MKLPPYTIYPYLSDEKIALRQILTSDIKYVAPISFYNAIKAKTLFQAAEMQEKINKDYENGNSIHWGIVDKSTNNLVGTCGYYRGLGFMTAAMQLAIDFGLNTISLKRVRAITTKQNEKAIQLLNRLNFTKIADLEYDEIEYELRKTVL